MSDFTTQRAFVVGMMNGDEAKADTWLAKLNAEGRDLASAIRELIERREAGLPFDPA